MSNQRQKSLLNIGYWDRYTPRYTMECGPCGGRFQFIEGKLQYGMKIVCDYCGHVFSPEDWQIDAVREEMQITRIRDAEERDMEMRQRR